LATFLPVVYSLFFPPRDIQQIVRALEMREKLPPQLDSLAQQMIAQVGPLKRALQIGYHVGVSETIRYHASHSSKTTQVSYIAWFQKLPKPILLLIMRNETDGVVDSYDIEQGAPMSVVGALAAPVLTFAFSLFLVWKRKSPMLAEEASPSRMPDESSTGDAKS